MAGSITPDQGSPRLADYRELWALKLAKLKGRVLFARSKEQYQDFYEDYFVDEDQTQYYRDHRMAIRRDTINALLAKYMPQGGKLLDCGCGLGDVLSGIRGPYELFGFDFSHNNVKRTAKRLEGKATIKQGSIYEIPYETGQFDGAVCTQVLEHIEDDERAVQDIARCLKVGAHFITSVPYNFYFPEYERLIGHFRHYTRESFQKLLAGSGFEIVEYYHNHPNWHQKYVSGYTWVRAKHMLFGRFLGSKSIYDFKWPWNSKPAIERLHERLLPLLERDSQLDYSKLSTSTNVVARKVR
jgi:SAM-dependent methyltransferase